MSLLTKLRSGILALSLTTFSYGCAKHMPLPVNSPPPIKGDEGGYAEDERGFIFSAPGDFPKFVFVYRELSHVIGPAPLDKIVIDSCFLIRKKESIEYEYGLRDLDCNGTIDLAYIPDEKEKNKFVAYIVRRNHPENCKALVDLSARKECLTKEFEVLEEVSTLVPELESTLFGYDLLHHISEKIEVWKVKHGRPVKQPEVPESRSVREKIYH